MRREQWLGQASFDGAEAVVYDLGDSLLGSSLRDPAVAWGILVCRKQVALGFLDARNVAGQSAVKGLREGFLHGG